MKKSIDFNSIVTLSIIGLLGLLFFKVTGSVSAVFSPDLSVKLPVKGAITKSIAQLEILANQLENEIFGSVNSDENFVIKMIQSFTAPDLAQFYNVFGRRTYGLNVFQKLDLVEYLKKCLDESEMQIIQINLINAGL